MPLTPGAQIDSNGNPIGDVNTNPLYTQITGSIAAQDRTSAAAGTEIGVPIMGADGNIVRVVRVGSLGTMRSTTETLLFHDSLGSTTVNPLWTQSTTTFTITKAAYVMTLNAGNVTTANSFAIITSKRMFAKFIRQPLIARWKVRITANVVGNHTLSEFGFGTATGTTAAVTNGAFFRWRIDGTLAAVVSYGSTEIVTQVLAQGVINTSNYYQYDVIIDDDVVRFIVSAADGNPVVDTQVSISATASANFSNSHVPTFARTYVDATGGGTSIQTLIGAHMVQMLDALNNKPWSDQLAGCGRFAGLDPVSGSQTPSLTTDANTTPSVSSGLAAMGGVFNASTYPVSTTNLLEHFAYLVPSPYTFYLTGISIPQAVVSTAFTGGPVTLVYYVWAGASTKNTSTATGGTKIPIGQQFFATTQAVGNIGSSISINFRTPVIVPPGTYLILGCKAVGTAVTAGVVRHTWCVDGYWE